LKDNENTKKSDLQIKVTLQWSFYNIKFI
jgi:hypothetical protein